jgi:hypothetical protein
MDPRHKLYKTLDNLAIEPNNTHTENMSARTDDEAARVQATSGVTMEGLKKKLEEGLGATYVEIEDLSGTFSHIIYLQKFRPTLGVCVEVVGCWELMPQVTRIYMLIRDV